MFKKSHISIIYGRNGSGKTTIAKSIRQLVGKDTEQPNEDGYTAFSVSSDSVITEDKKDSVFIFDEEFVRLNVRTQGKGLETIVMMGEQVDLGTQMAKKKEEKVETEKKLQEFLNLKAKFEDSSNTSSPQYFYRKNAPQLSERHFREVPSAHNSFLHHKDIGYISCVITICTGYKNFTVV